MTIQNFKTKAEITMTTELEAWKAGEKKWNVNNQFNESILESALESITDESAVKAFDIFGDKNVHPMDYAHFFSAFEAPELESAWTR